MDEYVITQTDNTKKEFILWEYCKVKIFGSDKYQSEKKFMKNLVKIWMGLLDKNLV